MKKRQRELLSGNSDALYKVAYFRYNELLGNIMERNVFLCKSDESIKAVATEMSKRRISSAIVTDQELLPVGIVTERDMVRKVVAENNTTDPQKPIFNIMTPNPIYLLPDDTLFDALSILSRYAIKHLPIVSMKRVVGIVTLRQLMKIQHSEPLVIIGLLDQAKSLSDYRNLKESLVQMVDKKISIHTDPVDIVTMISLINADIHKRLFERALKEQSSPPPVDFCLYVTGSHGRRENLLFPDQDFGLIIDDYDDQYYNEYDQFFLRVSQSFSQYLDKAGFPFCTGNVMSTNPTWRKRLTEWFAHLTYLFEHQNEYTTRYMTLIFDCSYLYGSKELFARVRDYAFKNISDHHNILRQMHEEEGGHKVPLGIFSTFITEKEKGHRGEIDMKRSGLIFLIEAARVLALKEGIRETSTLERLKALVATGVINRDDAEYYENAYRVILYHTLKAQVDNYLKRSTSNYYLNPRELSSRNQEILKQAFKAVSNLQEFVASEFGESIL